MKKYFSNQYLALYLFLFTLLIAMCSCTFPREVQKKEEVKNEDLEKVPLTNDFLNWIPSSILGGVQVQSGSDSTGFYAVSLPKPTVGQKGEIIFNSFPPVIVVPNTPGTIIQGGVVLKNGEVEYVKVSFWPGNNSWWLPFGPDSTGVFTLMTLIPGQKIGDKIVPKDQPWIQLGGVLYEVKSGLQNSIFVFPVWKDGIPQLAPGRKVGEQNPQKTSPIKGPPYKRDGN